MSDHDYDSAWLDGCWAERDRLSKRIAELEDAQQEFLQRLDRLPYHPTDRITGALERIAELEAAMRASHAAMRMWQAKADLRGLDEKDIAYSQLAHWVHVMEHMKEVLRND